MIVNKLKINKMKNLNIILIIFAFTTLSCKAQHIIPVEKAVEYRNTNEGLLGDKDYVYVKDVNNLLNKYVGVWKGSYNFKNYEFRIIKITEDDGELKKDLLLIRYKITDNIGNTIVSTLNLANNDKYIIKGDYLGKSGSYALSYLGLNAECGQNGDIFISIHGNNYEKMSLFLSVSGEIYYECTTGAVEQVLPIEQMELIKQ